VVPAQQSRSPTAGIGTELVAHGEKIEVTLHGSKYSRSPISGAIRWPPRASDGIKALA
jgi:hypothetical protein